MSRVFINNIYSTSAASLVRMSLRLGELKSDREGFPVELGKIVEIFNERAISEE